MDRVPIVTTDELYAVVLALRKTGPIGPTGPTGNTAGAVYTIRYNIGITTGVLSTSTIPASAVVTRATFRITTPFLPATGTTLWAGITGNTGAFVPGATASIAATAGSYVTTTDVPMGVTAGQVLYSVQNAPTAGAGTLAVEYVIPLS